MITRVLLVDDHAERARGLADQLIDHGCHVRVSQSGPQALKELEGRSYDLVLAGVGETPEEGMSLARTIRKSHPDTRVVVAAGDGGSSWNRPEEGGVEMYFSTREPGKLAELLSSRRRKAGGTVLLVDDHPEEVIGLGTLLSGMGYEVLTAASGEEAVETARRRPIDVALVDFKMPRMSGWDTTQALRAASPGIRCVIVTGCSLADYVQKCFDQNDVPVVNKVFNPREMLGLVSAHLPDRGQSSAESILLVDDDDGIRRVISEILTGKGFLVQTADCGEAALALAREVVFSVVIVDYGLPDTNGLDLVERLKGIHHDSKFMLLTGRPDMDTAVRAVQSGVNAYLSKPLPPDLLTDTLARVVREYRLERQVRDLARDLYHVNERLEKMDEVKSRFLFIVAHDIRSPLAAIRGFSQYLLGGDKMMAPEVREGLEHILHGSRNIGRLVEDLLDLGRMETGQLSVRRERTDLPSLLRKIQSALSTVAREEGLELSCDFAGAPAQAELDPLRLEQVIGNLAANAFKHGRSGKTVGLSVRSSEGNLLVEVRDRGPGISPDVLERIFDPYYQGDGDSGRGIGLGLSIVRELVRAHGGRVWAESGGPGAGSVFKVEMPLDGV